MESTTSENGKVEKNFECSDCNRSFSSERGLSTHKGKAHFDTQPVPLHLKTGYEYWDHRYQGEYDTVAVHQLLAIADGESPYDVFNPDTDVHHSDIEHPRANILGNLELVDHTEHAHHHNPAIPDDSLLSDLNRLADELGRSPTCTDINEHGKYGVGTYYNHFGGIETARREAGLLEKSEDVDIDISHLEGKEDTPTVDISHLEETEQDTIVDISHLEQKEQDMTVDISHLQQEKSVVDVSHLE